MKSVAYIRVSSEEQVQGTSLDSQKRACLEYAERNGLELSEDDIYREEGVSGTMLNRPQLVAMLNRCTQTKGEIGACIVWKVDRLARKAEYHQIIKAQLAKNGVRLMSVTEPIGEGATGDLMENMLAAFAQFDNDIRTLRTTTGMRARTKQGGWPHDAPYGYKKARTVSGISTIEPDETEAPIITALLEKFATGSYTIKEAASLAYKMGIRNRKGEQRDWQSIKNMLVSPLYAGLIQTKYTDGESINGLHEALISEKTHLRILSIVDGSLKNYSKHAELDWPLRGGFLKHTCGNAITGSATKGRNGPSPRYSCVYCRASKGAHISKRRELAHDEFMMLLSSVRPDEAAQRLFKEVTLRRWNVEFKEAVEHNARLNVELDACKDRKSRIIDLFIDGKLTENEKTTKLAEVEIEMGRLKLQSVEADRYAHEKEAIIDGALLFMSDPGAFWNIASVEVRKRVQAAIFPEGIEYDFDKGFRTAKMSESYLLIKEIADESAINPSLARQLVPEYNLYERKGS